MYSILPMLLPPPCTPTGSSGAHEYYNKCRNHKFTSWDVLDQLLGDVAVHHGPRLLQHASLGETKLSHLAGKGPHLAHPLPPCWLGALLTESCQRGLEGTTTSCSGGTMSLKWTVEWQVELLAYTYKTSLYKFLSNGMCGNEAWLILTYFNFGAELFSLTGHCWWESLCSSLRVTCMAVHHLGRCTDVPPIHMEYQKYTRMAQILLLQPDILYNVYASWMLRLHVAYLHGCTCVYLSYGCNSLRESGSQLIFHFLLLSSCCFML